MSDPRTAEERCVFESIERCGETRTHWKHGTGPGNGLLRHEFQARPPADPRTAEERLHTLRDAVVAAMPWYDEAHPDYTELDDILRAALAAEPVPVPRGMEDEIGPVTFGPGCSEYDHALDCQCPYPVAAAERDRLRALAAEPVPVPDVDAADTPVRAAIRDVLYETRRLDGPTVWDLGIAIEAAIRQSPSIDMERLADLMERVRIGEEGWRLVIMTEDGGLSVTSGLGAFAEAIAAEYARLATPPEPKKGESG